MIQIKNEQTVVIGGHSFHRKQVEEALQKALQKENKMVFVTDGTGDHFGPCDLSHYNYAKFSLSHDPTGWAKATWKENGQEKETTFNITEIKFCLDREKAKQLLYFLSIYCVQFPDKT